MCTSERRASGQDLVCQASSLRSARTRAPPPMSSHNKNNDNNNTIVINTDINNIDTNNVNYSIDHDIDNPTPTKYSYQH